MELKFLLGLFTYDEVQTLLKQQNPPRYKQGVTILITGHYNSGARLIAKALQCVLDQSGSRKTSLFLGDSIEESIKLDNGESELNARTLVEDYTRESSLEVISHVCSQISKNGGIAITTPVIGTEESRKAFKRQQSSGGYYLVHVSTSLETCIETDRFGVYDKSKTGVLYGDEKCSTVPNDADLVVDPTKQSISQIVHEIVLMMEEDGYLKGN